jgi:sugar phosphate isomerase/epimerase
VHPGERLDQVAGGLVVAGRVRRALGVERLGLGLWLSRGALAELAEAGGAAWLRDALAREGLAVFTMNGFPYGDFHAPVVKRAVYHPDWTSDARRAHTLALAEILAALVGPVGAGTISTLPLGHRAEIAGDTAAVEARAAEQLAGLAAALARLADTSGAAIRVCLEPEPGCLLERTADAVRWFGDVLPAAARRAGVARGGVERHLGVCFDTCHQAIAFEDAAAALDALADAGIAVGKVQLSSALEIARPSDPAARAALAGFDEPRFLHQVRAGRAGEIPVAVDDLDRLDELPTDRAWRVHFHVPIHRAEVGGLPTTRRFLEAALAALARRGGSWPDLEVETYTWSVLPPGERVGEDGLVDGLAAELAWARAALAQAAVPANAALRAGASAGERDG